MRKLSLALNSIISLILLSVIVIGVNYISFRHYKKWDFSRDNKYKLSNQTKSILKNLNRDITIYVCFSPRVRMYDWIKALLEQYKRYTHHLKVKFVDIERDIDKVKILYNKYKVMPRDVVIFVSGNRHKIIYERDLIEMDYSPVMRGEPPRPAGFNGEQVFTSAIVELCSKAKPIVYFSVGHGERSIDDMRPGQGLHELADFLKKQGFFVKKAIGLNWSGQDKSVLVICRPKVAFLPEEIAKVNSFLKKGGRVLFLLDPGVPDVFREWLKKDYHVVVGNNVVVDPLLHVLNPVNLFVNYYGLHPITKPLIGKALLLTQVCSVSWRGKRGKTNFSFTPLLFSSAKSWAEVDWHSPHYEYDKGKDLKGPVSLAVAGENVKTGTRLVVVGDSDFVSNMAIDNLSNKEFLLATLNWLMHFKDRINIPSHPIKTIKLNIPYARLRAIFFFTVLLLPLGVVVLGFLIVFFRKR